MAETAGRLAQALGAKQEESNMDPGIINFLTIVGTFLSVVGLAYAVIVARRQERRKLLSYDIHDSLPIATVLPNRIDNRLSIIYEREGEEPESIRGAYVNFIQIGNLGKEPIRRDDIAPADPPRIVIENAKVLDLVLSKVTREVNNFSLSSFSQQENGNVSSQLGFDFLDHQDGAIIRLLTDSPNPRISLLGTIIGMPHGIRSINEIGANTILNRFGCGAAVLLQLAAIVGALIIFNSVTGGWQLLWVFLLPVAALLLPGIFVALVFSLLWPKGPQWPSRLSLPDWFVISTSVDQRSGVRRGLIYGDPIYIRDQREPENQDN